MISKALRNRDPLRNGGRDQRERKRRASGLGAAAEAQPEEDGVRDIANHIECFEFTWSEHTLDSVYQNSAGRARQKKPTHSSPLLHAQTKDLTDGSYSYVYASVERTPDPLLF